MAGKATRLLASGRCGASRRGSTLLTLLLGCTAACTCTRVEPEQEPAIDAPGETNDGTSSPMTLNVPEALLEAALDDAAQRTSMERAQIKVVSAAAVTWSDGAAGCPEPGMMYTQALVPGYRIVLQAGEQVLNYHAGRSGAPRYCPAERVVAPVGAGDHAT